MKAKSDAPKAAGKRSPSPKKAPAKKRNVMLVDDHPLIRAGLAELISKQKDLTVCFEAGNPAEGFSEIERRKPDIIVTDLTMPGRSGIEFIKDLLAMHGDLPILVLSMHDEMVYAERILRAGARGYIMKEAGAEKLLLAIRQVLNGQVYVSDRISAKLLDNLTGRRPRGSSSPIEKLTDREFEVFRLIGNGMTTKEIAAQLNLSPKTVDVHRGHIKEKLDIKDAMALVREAVRWVETE